MDNKKLIEYLSIKGFDEDKIAMILAHEIERRGIERLIHNYEEELIANGFSRTEALENFRSFQAIKRLAEEKKKIGF